MTKYLLSTILLTLALSPAAQAETLYVSDELKVALRSGDTRQHRILKFIPSGTRLTVLETNDDGSFTKVSLDDGKDGWVETTNLQSSPGARELLDRAGSRIERLNASISKQKQEIVELRTSLDEAETQKARLDRFGQEKSDELETLRKVAARPVQLAQQKQALEAELRMVKSELAIEKAKNVELSDSSIKEWFVIGAAVSLFSLFAGLIIPSIRWRRKRDSWGGGF